MSNIDDPVAYFTQHHKDRSHKYLTECCKDYHQMVAEVEHLRKLLSITMEAINEELKSQPWAISRINATIVRRLEGR